MDNRDPNLSTNKEFFPLNFFFIIALQLYTTSSFLDQHYSESSFHCCVIMVLAPRKFLLSCCSILCVLLALAIGGILHFLNRSILPEGKFFATVIPAFSGFIPPTVLHTETADVAGVPSLHCDPEGRSAHEKACDLAPRPAKEMFIPMPSGAQMPANGLGMCCRPAAYGFEAARRQVLHYLRLGGRLIDTAELYLNHVPISLALHQAMEAKEKGGWGIPRSEIFLVTKVWPRHYGRETVKLRVREIVRGNSTKWLPHEAARARAEHLDEDAESSRSLSLRLHFADLVLMHQPVSWQAGLAGKLVGNGMGMSAECATLTFQECRKQTWIGLSELVAEGVVKNIGVSNFNVAHMKELQHLRESSNAGTVPIQSIAVRSEYAERPIRSSWLENLFVESTSVTADLARVLETFPDTRWGRLPVSPPFGCVPCLVSPPFVVISFPESIPLSKIPPCYVGDIQVLEGFAVFEGVRCGLKP